MLEKTNEFFGLTDWGRRVEELRSWTKEQLIREIGELSGTKCGLSSKWRLNKTQLIGTISRMTAHHYDRDGKITQRL